MSSCFSRCLRVPIAIPAFYESYLWILQTLFAYASGLTPRAARTGMSKLLLLADFRLVAGGGFEPPTFGL
jgi:hypothetical protein